MLRKNLVRLASILALCVAPLAIATSATAETKVGTTVESRTLLGFKADDAAIQAMMPEGWKAITLPKGPFAGANMMFVVMDQHLIRDAEGKPATPSKNRVGAAIAYGVKKDVKGARLFLLEVYEPSPIINPYSNSVAAQISRTSGSNVAADGSVTKNDAWTIQPESGGLFSFNLNYASGTAGWTEGGAANPYSAADPEFNRIYRYDQMAELLMSSGMGKPLAGDIEYEVSIPSLAAAFTGEEELVAVLSIPIYIREIFLP